MSAIYRVSAAGIEKVNHSPSLWHWVGCVYVAGDIQTARDARAHITNKPPITPIKYAAFIAAPATRPRDAYARGFEVIARAIIGGAVTTCPRCGGITPSGKCHWCDAATRSNKCIRENQNHSYCCACLDCRYPPQLQKLPRSDPAHTYARPQNYTG